MALIKCDECGREISSKSLFCPGCGYPTHLNSALGGAVSEPEAVKQIREQMTAAEPAQPAEPETPQPAPQPQPAPAPIPEPEPAPEPQEQEQPQEPEEPEEQEPAEDLEEEQPRTPSRRNERIKVWLFLGVFLILLGVVLYFYFTAPVEPIEDETVAGEIEAVEDAASDSIASDLPDTDTDTAAVAAPAAAATAPAPVTAPAAVTPKPRTAPQPARESSGEVREIKVAPLSEQARAPRHTTPEPETDNAE